MKVSYIKLAMKYLFGGKEAVLDYILDLANAAVANLSAANKEKIKAAVALAENLLGWMDKLLAFCPQKWRGAWHETTLALAAVVNAADDLEVTPEELKDVTAKFAVAYAAWRAPDEGTLLAALAEDTAVADEAKEAVKDEGKANG